MTATEQEKQEDAGGAGEERFSVMPDWASAVDALNTEKWSGDELHGLWESAEGLKGTTEQRFGILGIVLSEDGRSIGLAIDPQVANYLGADIRPDGCSFWLSRPDAQRLGLALLKQATSSIVSLDELLTLRIPPLVLA